MRIMDRRQEVYFVAVGICGVTLYFLLENIALTYIMASNVGIFFIGFVIAMLGVSLITFNGNANFHINPLGDLLAVVAAIVWAAYSVLTKKIAAFGHHVIPTTRRIFGYGLLFMFPALFLMELRLDLARFAKPVYLFNILFFGLLASALCFVTWNYAVEVLGAVKTSVFMYITPVVTVVTSVIVLKETITLMAVGGDCADLGRLVYFREEGERWEIILM